jgi:hypothetical protein
MSPTSIHASSLSSARAAAGELLVASELCAAKIYADDELHTSDHHDIELRARVELRVDEPAFVQAISRCCKSMF